MGDSGKGAYGFLSNIIAHGGAVVDEKQILSSTFVT
jgi:hypothetical protein